MPKSVFVTGATDGTGFAIAERFAKEGYNVFITSRNGERAEQSAKKISDKYKVFAKGIGLAVGSEDLVKEVFEDIKKQGYSIDTLVLNAANLGINQDILTVDMKEFQSVFETNIFWNIMIVRQAALQMIEKKKGSVVFITSNTAYRAIPNRVAYAGSKGGILGMSRSLALDLGKYGIRFNCVLPGMIKTSRWREGGDIKKVLSNYTPIGDIAEFEDIANAAWYFGSDQSNNTTGAELIVDGGNSAQLYPIVPEERLAELARIKQ